MLLSSVICTNNHQSAQLRLLGSNLFQAWIFAVSLPLSYFTSLGRLSHSTRWPVELDQSSHNRQTICERFYRTILNEFYQVTFRKNHYSTLEKLQKDIADWAECYNNDRTHQSKMFCGWMPMETLLGGKLIWTEKKFSSNLNRQVLTKNGKLSDQVWTSTHIVVNTKGLCRTLTTKRFCRN